MTALATALHRRRETLRSALLVAAACVPVLALAAAVVVDGWAARRFLVLYSAPLFVALFLWMRLRLARIADDAGAALRIDALAVALGFLRFTGGWLPFSGHMLFFVYSGLTTRSRGYVLAAAVLALETTWFKLVLWHDAASWALGIASGAVLAAVRLRLAPSPSPHSAEP